jgi:Transglutaminase-like superfamily
MGLGKGFAPSVAAANAALGGKVHQDIHPAGTAGTAFSLSEMAKRIKEGRNDPRMRAWAGQTIARAEAQQLAKHIDWNAWIESDKLPGGGYVVRAKSKAKEISSATGKTLTEAWQELAARLRGIAGLSPGYGKLKTNSSQAQAILDEIRRVTYYVQDPVNTELMAKPHVTLCLDDHGLCMSAADCDDRVIAFASATMAIGIETRVVGQAYGTPQATHVIAAILDPDKHGWQKVDPSSEKYNVGDAFPATKEWWMDPITGSTSESSNGPKTSLGQEPENGDFIGVGAVPVREPEGVGVMPFAHAFSPLAHGASYVPVGLENGLPCQPDGTECGDDCRVIAEIAQQPDRRTMPKATPASQTGLSGVPRANRTRVRDCAFAQPLVRGLGAVPLYPVVQSPLPDFHWDNQGGFWISSSMSRPTMSPAGLRGKWRQSSPYGQRLRSPEGVLSIDSSRWPWIWYPMPENTAHWYANSVWVAFSKSRPTSYPTIPFKGAPDMWVTTAPEYWIFVANSGIE